MPVNSTIASFLNAATNLLGATSLIQAVTGDEVFNSTLTNDAGIPLAEFNTFDDKTINNITNDLSSLAGIFVSFPVGAKALNLLKPISRLSKINPILSRGVTTGTILTLPETPIVLNDVAQNIITPVEGAKQLGIAYFRNFTMGADPTRSKLGTIGYQLLTTPIPQIDAVLNGENIDIARLTTDAILSVGFGLKQARDISKIENATNSIKQQNAFLEKISKLGDISKLDENMMSYIRDNNLIPSVKAVLSKTKEFAFPQGKLTDQLVTSGIGNLPGKTSRVFETVLKEVPEFKSLLDKSKVSSFVELKGLLNDNPDVLNKLMDFKKRNFIKKPLNEFVDSTLYFS